MEIPATFGPAPTPSRVMPAMSTQRKELLDVLAAQSGPSTVDEIAELTGLHANTVRSHLDGLVGDGLVSRDTVRNGRRGRPSWHYRVIAERMSGAPEYVALAMALAEQVAQISDDPRTAARLAGKRWAAAVPGESTSVAAVTELLDDLGFAPERQGKNIRLTQCPLLSAARQNPEVVCGVHEGLILGRLGADEHGRLESFAGPGYCMWHGGDRASDS